MKPERIFEHIGHWLFIQLSDGYMHCSDFIEYGKHEYIWGRVPQELLNIHGNPVARFLVKHSNNKRKRTR